MAKKDWGIIFFLITGRLVLLLLTFAITNANNVGDSFVSFPDFLTSYGHRWDGNSYSFLAKNGYVRTGSEADFIVFPPVYPLIISPLGFLLNNYPLAGMLLSNIFFVVGMFIFYKLLLLDYDQDFSLYTTILVALFPSSFIFSVAYPESLFFMVVTSTFYLLRTQKIGASFLLAGLAPLTRPFGIAIYPSLLATWLFNKNKKYRDLFILILSGMVAGFIYLSLNYFVFGNIFAFQEKLATAWQKSFSWPWVGIFNSWNTGITSTDPTYKIYVGYSEAIASTMAWLFLILSIIIKKFRMRVEYTIYLLIGVFLFTSTGFILSAPRYLLSLPPFFIILAKLTNQKILGLFWVIVSTSLVIFLSVRWSEGWWVF